MDQETLINLLEYDLVTGVFRWRRRRRGVRPDRLAGFNMKNGYLGIGIDGKNYYAHRLAWIYVHGEIPEGMHIDHINGDKRDNRIANLRVGTQGQNLQNLRAARSDNKLGMLGVCFDKSRGKYKAYIAVNGK